jgi:hypothetical protein
MSTRFEKFTETFREARDKMMRSMNIALSPS